MSSESGALQSGNGGKAPPSLSDTARTQAAILVAEDDETLRALIVQMLNLLGYHNVTTAEDGQVVLDLLRERTFDILLLDIEMPHVDGFGVLTALKGEAFRSQLPIIVTSGLEDMAAVVRSIELGAEDFLHKPVDLVLLRARLGASLERKFLRDLEREYQREIEEQKRLVEIEQEKSKALLLNILPQPIAARLMEGERDIAERYSDVTILFADLVNFTQLSGHTDPETLVGILNDVFSRFDFLADRNGLEKIKTIGDCYMVVGGLPLPSEDHAAGVARMSLGMIDAIADVNRERGCELDVRIGINSGPVVAGVIGRKKFTYDLWGQTVNIASRMESSGTPGKIQVSHDTWTLLKSSFVLSERGMVECKGIGEIKTFFLERSIR